MFAAIKDYFSLSLSLWFYCYLVCCCSGFCLFLWGFVWFCLFVGFWGGREGEWVGLVGFSEKFSRVGVEARSAGCSSPLANKNHFNIFSSFSSLGLKSCTFLSDYMYLSCRHPKLLHSKMTMQSSHFFFSYVPQTFIFHAVTQYFAFELSIAFIFG